MWFLSCTSGIMVAQVYTHAHALQQPDQCSSVIGGASCSGLQVPNVWKSGRRAGRGSVYKRTRMRSKNRIVARCSSIDRWSSLAGILQGWWVGDREQWQWTMPPSSPKCLAFLRAYPPPVVGFYAPPWVNIFFWPAATVVASPCLYQRRLASDSSSCLEEILGEVRGTRWLLFQLPEKHTWKSLLLFWHEK